MTQDELIKNITWLAQEAGLQTAYPIDHPMSKFIMAIEARATEKEREACAKIIYDSWESTTAGEGIPEDWLLTLAELIKARGQA